MNDVLSPDDLPAGLIFDWRSALAAVDRGEFVPAVTACDRILAEQPHWAPALAHRGAAYLLMGRPDQALADFDAALALRPHDIQSACNRGVALQRLGRLDEAAGAYSRVLALAPDDQQAGANLGLVLDALGRAEEALSQFDQTLALGEEPTCRQARAALRSRLGDHRGALGDYVRLIALRPDLAHLRRDAAIQERALGNLAQALAFYDQALGLQPTWTLAQVERAGLLVQGGQGEAAIEGYRQALDLDPASSDAMLGMAEALLLLERDSEAMAWVEQAADTPPSTDPIKENARGQALMALRRHEEALAVFDSVAASTPLAGMAHNNRAIALRELGRLHEALDAYDRALDLQPHDPVFLVHRGQDRLLAGQEAGLDDLEARKRMSLPVAVHELAVPEWSGQALKDRRILGFSEQGLGDTLQFCRYLSLLADRGADVVFDPHPALRGIFGGFDPRVKIAEQAGAGDGFDFKIPLMSLPRLLGLDAGRTWHGPYLSADAERISAWRARIGRQGLKVGIAWRGSRQGARMGKAFTLSDLAPLQDAPGLRLISLQRGARSEVLSQSQLPIEDLGPEFDEGSQAFLDTAAVMTSLDLVISTDSAVAHLAGALGRPVWIPLKRVPDWRWGMTGEHTGWYPSARLFRQTRQDDWASVFDAMAQALPSLSPP